MDLIAKNKIKNELKKKYYLCFLDEKEFMQKDLDKILNSLGFVEEKKENDPKKDLIKEKNEAINCLDIKKIKTLNFEINNVD